jgi:4-hydroxy-tetrahydrodipicolinate synthase
MEIVELKGTIVPLVTPFKPNESFDAKAMSRLIEFVLAQGASAIMPTALTGEGPLLEADETIQVWDAVFSEVAGRLPVIPAIISTTTRKAARLASQAEKLGAPAIMVAPLLPELYAGRSHDDVYSFYAEVGSEIGLPIILFNYPSLTGVDFTPGLVERLTGVPNVRYIKESTGDTRRVHAIQRLVGDRLSVICGAPNVALECLALGCRAWITGIMNVAPRSAAQLMSAVVEKNDLTLARLIYYRQLLPIVDILARNFNPTGTIKAGLRARGVEVGVPRRPGSDVRAADRDRLALLAENISRAEAEVADALLN